MSIYATLWKLKFPKEGDEHLGCEWIEVTAQAVPPHIGSPTPGNGYEGGDPYAAFSRPYLKPMPMAKLRMTGLWSSSPNTRLKKARSEVVRNTPARFWC